MALLKPKQTPDAQPKRIICHWSAGAYKASDLDRKHYHFAIEDDGEVVQGIHTVADNDSTGDGKYAAHTRRCNTRSIGISVCCMAGATKANPGRFPMTKVQWTRLAELAAELCKRYDIPVTPNTVLGHFEVQENLGIAQRGKWDPGFLPWEPGLGESEVGRRFRNLVSTFLDGDSVEEEVAGADISVTVQGKVVAGAVSVNEEPMVPVKSLVETFKIAIPYANATHAVIEPGHDLDPIYLPFEFLDEGVEVDEDAGEDAAVALVIEKGYISVNAAAEELNLAVDYDAAKNIMSIGIKAVRGKAAKSPQAGYQEVVVRRGDTLSRIAARYLKTGDRWTQLRKPDGTPFSARDARTLRVGQVVLVPVLAEVESEKTVTTLINVPPPSLNRIGEDEELVLAVQRDFRDYARESIPVIYAECMSSGVTLPAQIAYVLATSEHESGCGKWMRELWGPTAAQRGYQGRRDLDNTQPGDGLRFRGRGYVQITGRVNYRDWSQRTGIDLIANPDRVASDPSLAARILVQGMRDGTFTGKKLTDYIRPGEEPDFYNARAMINGDKRKNGERIASHASRYMAALIRANERAVEEA